MDSAAFLHRPGNDSHSPLHRTSGDNFISLGTGPADKILSGPVEERVYAAARRAEHHNFPVRHPLEEICKGNGHSVEIAPILERIPDLAADVVELAGIIVQRAEIPEILDGGLESPDINARTET